MGKGPNITPEITNLIATIYIANKAIGPTAARKELLKKMKERGFDKNFGPDYPKVSTVSVYLKRFKKKGEERSPESKSIDEPWSYSSLAKYPIAPEAMPIVAAIYEKCALESNFSDRWMPSIREMLWVGRLYKIIEFHKNKTQPVPPDVKDEILDRISQVHKNGDQELISKLRSIEEGSENPNLAFASYFGLKVEEIPLEDIVLEWAFLYSDEEVFHEVVGEPFDSREFDGYLMSYIYEFLGDRRQHFIADLSEEYDIDVDKLIEPNMSLGDIEEAARLYKEAKNEGTHNEKG